MLKAIHAQANKEAAKEKAKLHEMKLSKAAEKLEAGLEETLTYMDFSSEHWLRIRTNNVKERVNGEIKRITRVIGTFPDGQSVLMPVCARLWHIASNSWGTKRYLNMKHLADLMTDETYLKEKSHNNDLICKGCSSKIVVTAVMCTGRQVYLGCYVYWTRKNLRKTIDSTEP